MSRSVGDATSQAAMRAARGCARIVDDDDSDKDSGLDGEGKGSLSL